MSKEIILLSKVKVDLNEYEIEDLTPLEKKRLKKNIRRKIPKSPPVSKILVRNGLIAGLVIGAFCIGGGTIAANIDIGGYDFEYLRNSKDGAYSDYKTIIGKTVYDSGVNVKLNEVIFDNDVLMINTTFQFDKNPLEKSKNPFLQPVINIYINGKLVDFTSSTGTLQRNTGNEFIGEFEYSIDDVNFQNKNMDIKIVFSDIRGNDFKSKGKWVFEFNCDREQLLKDTTCIEIGNTFDIEGVQKVEVSTIQMNPVAAQINFRTDNKEYEVGFNVEDNLGNKYPMTRLRVRYGNREGTDNIGYMRLESIDEEATQLFITPYYAAYPEKSGKGPGKDDYVLLKDCQYIVDIKK